MLPHSNHALEKNFLLSLALTIIILIAEVIGGLWTGSLALLADAAHVFMDVFALALSFIALRLSALPPDDRHTYGYHRLEVLAALINGITLGAIAIEIFSEAWQRGQHPVPIHSGGMLVIAGVGLIGNTIVAFILGKHTYEGHGALAVPDLNVHSAYLHVIGDAISSVGVILAAALMWLTGWLWLDPLISLLIGILIVVNSWRVLKSAVHILIEGVPEHLSVNKIGHSMASVPGVLNVHDLHVWSICSGQVALSAHVVTPYHQPPEGDKLMSTLKTQLRDFGIEHTTIQFESIACEQRDTATAQAAGCAGNVPTGEGNR